MELIKDKIVIVIIVVALIATCISVAITLRARQPEATTTESNTSDEDTNIMDIASEISTIPIPPPIAPLLLPIPTLPTFPELPQVVAGHQYSLALLPDGSLWRWGSNTWNQAFLDVRNPVPTRIINDVVMVSSGMTHTMVLTSSGILWALIDHQQTNEPIRLMDDVVYVSSGIDTSAAITSDGSLWVWWNAWHEINADDRPFLVLQDTVSVTVGNSIRAVTTNGTLVDIQLESPILFNSVTEEVMEDVIFATSSHNNHLAITNDGMLWEGRTKIIDNIVFASAGANHSMAITSDGTLWGWGYNQFGQVGNGVASRTEWASEDAVSPMRIMESVATVSAGTNHTLAVTTDGRMWAWGANSRGEIGDGSILITRPSPVELHWQEWANSEISWHDITLQSTLQAYQEFLSAAIDVYGNAQIEDFIYPNNRQVGIIHAELITPEEHSSDIPQLAIVKREFDNALNEYAILQYMGGRLHLMSIELEENLPEVIQESLYEYIDIGTTLHQIELLLERLDSLTFDIPIIPMLPTVPIVEAGYDATFVVLPDGSLWGIGNLEIFMGTFGIFNDYAQYNNTHTPIKIMEDVVSVSAGRTHLMILTTDGVLWAIGSSPVVWSAIGNITTIRFDEPAKVMEDVVAISAGDSVSAAITADGAVWAWGLEREWDDRTNPPLMILENAGSVSAGTFSINAVTIDGVLWDTNVGIVADNMVSVSFQYSHRLAIANDGTLWGWGRDGIHIRLMENVVHASAGEIHSMALTNDGVLWIWGSDFEPHATDSWLRTTPVRVMDSVVNISAGHRHSLAVTEDGRVWAWGVNEEPTEIIFY